MTKVTLRTKPISGGRHTLYLDYYPPIPNPETGKPTRREFLKLYLFDKVKTPFEKQHNKETQALAETIKAKRQIAIQNGEYGFIDKTKQNLDFVQYFRELAEKRKASNQDNWMSALKYFEQFTGGTLKMPNLNERVCNEFKDYLLTAPRAKNQSHKTRSESKPLSQNSAVSYFNKLKATLKQAFKDGLLQTDLNAKVEAIKTGETHREYLSLEELQALVKVECALPILKQAALFSALTGLRFSDIEKLVWGEVQYSEAEGHFIRFRQQKTKGVEVHPISEGASKLMGEKGEPNQRVFNGLYYSAYANTHLKQWVLKAGIARNITFHSFRHTYATLQLSLGTDIYTVSKMLGHRELKTTQIYAKIIDQTKREAANKIKLDF
jgi:integrase